MFSLSDSEGLFLWSSRGYRPPLSANSETGGLAVTGGKEGVVDSGTEVSWLIEAVSEEDDGIVMRLARLPYIKT